MRRRQSGVGQIASLIMGVIVLDVCSLRFAFRFYNRGHVPSQCSDAFAKIINRADEWRSFLRDKNRNVVGRVGRHLEAQYPTENHFITR